MDKENKVIELNDEELERVAGGFGGGPCPYGYSKPSSSTCNSGCIEYSTRGGGVEGGVFGPFCDWFMSNVK